MVADDLGDCFAEIVQALGPAGLKLDQATTMEECIDKARKFRPAVVVVYAAMKRAFSLLRLLRHSDDLAGIPLVVVGEPDQEGLIVKHRKLPSRADRYLLRPLDPELVKSVVEEFLGTNPEIIIPELPERLTDAHFEAPPDAYEKMESEIQKYRDRVSQLERDLQAVLKSSKDMTRLREENEELTAALEEASANQAPAEDYSELFRRLESGYKDTIEDLEHLIGEKDEIIANLAASDELDGEERQALTGRLEEEQARSGEMKKVIRQLSGVMDEMSKMAEDIGLEAALEDWDSHKQKAGELSAAFSFDEETLVVSAEVLKRELNGGDDGGG